MKKIISMLLILCFTVSMLASCSSKVTAQSLVEQANETVSKAESVENDVALNLDAKVNVFGMDMQIGMDADFNVKSDNKTNVAYLSGNLKLDMPFLSSLVAAFGGDSEDAEDNTNIDMEGYVVKNGDVYSVYTKSGDEDWVKAADSSESGSADLNGFASVLENMDAFTLEKDTEDFNGKTAYVVTGTLTGEAISKAMSSIATSDALENTDIDWNDMSFNTRLYFDKDSKAPLGTNMVLASPVSQTTESDGLTTTVEISTMEMTTTYVSFNELDEIKVPDEVLNAPTADELAEADSDDDYFDDVDTDSDYTDDTEDSYFDDYTSSGNYLDESDFEAFQISGKDYFFPFKLSYLIDDGYTIEEDYAGEYFLNPDDSEYVSMYKEGDELRCYVNNLNDELTDIKECAVTNFYTDTDMGGNIISFKGLDFDSTSDQIKATLGEPSTSSSYGDYDMLSYTTDDYSYEANFYVDSETGAPLEIELSYYGY